MDISIIIVSYNTSNLIVECVSKLQLAATGLAFEIIFVDNASSDDSVKVIQNNYPESKLIVNSVNVGFGRANNQALPMATGNFILLLNTDAFVTFDTLNKTVSYMAENPRCGILGVRLEGSDGELQPCARYFPTPFNQFLRRSGLHTWFKGVRLVDDMNWSHSSVRHCDWVVGCYYLVRREVINQIGLFDPRYFLYFEEVDHCFAAQKAGWDVIFYPYTTVVHLGGESAKSIGLITKNGRQLSELQMESELLYFRKNHGLTGCIIHIALSVCIDALAIVKSVFKGGIAHDATNPWRHMRLLLSLFWRTKWGRFPTR